MAYTVKIGQFAKNIESTAQPNTTGWAEHSVTLKNGADISNPRIELQVSWDNIKDANYAVMMNRYYWIIGKNMLRENLCQLSLRVDVLATYKNEIGSSNLYILRSSASYDGNIVDNFYPPTADVVYYSEGSNFFHSNSPYADGFYVVNVVGVNTNTGNSTLWKMDPDEFKEFINKTYLAINGYQPSDLLEALQQLAGGSPTKLISSAMWFPKGVDFTTSALKHPVIVGTWSPAVNAYLITDPIYQTLFTLDIHKHPQAATKGQYLNLAPYSIYTLNIPLFGSINIDGTQIIDCDTLGINVYVDAISGTAIANTQGTALGLTPPINAFLSAQLGVPLPLQGQNAGNTIVGGITSTIGSIAAGLVSANPIGAAIGAVSAGVGTIAGAISGSSFSTGSGGSVIAPNIGISLQSTHYLIADEDNARNGRPLCQLTTPASLGGFMIAQKGDVVMAGPLPEHEEVKRYLETGFFYE